MEKQIKIAAKGIIFSDEKVLVLHRSPSERKKNDSHGWDFPGGGLEPSESVLSALVREVMEETGLEVKVIAPAYIYDEIQEEKHLVIIKFACGDPIGQIQLSAEHEFFSWIQLKELSNTELPEWMKEEILRAYRIYSIYQKTDDR